ncbi:hypothetical protein [Nonomuraea rubra]|uniref:Uncharacterized protein n=1 Tax=Nonomuraea rubra TaxID=46180 RepID=A0A7X0P3M5_9ACTN|nr:hypothetical protein [Nonomuraea rubra]MBB6554643.1 hypothetical protein [Nonomuraea rubra]
MKGVGRGKRAVAALCALMSLPGCGTSIRLEADPVAVREASAVGTVMARTTQELLYENTVQVIHVMKVDVGEDNFADALSSVRRKALKDTVDGTYAYPMIELIKSNP